MSRLRLCRYVFAACVSAWLRATLAGWLQRKMQERHDTQVGALDASHGHLLDALKKESALGKLVELVHDFERCFEVSAPFASDRFFLLIFIYFNDRMMTRWGE
jgi:hypothetical protein